MATAMAATVAPHGQSSLFLPTNTIGKGRKDVGSPRRRRSRKSTRERGEPYTGLEIGKEPCHTQWKEEARLFNQRFPEVVPVDSFFSLVRAPCHTQLPTTKRVAMTTRKYRVKKKEEEKVLNNGESISRKKKSFFPSKSYGLLGRH